MKKVYLQLFCCSIILTSCVATKPKGFLFTENIRYWSLATDFQQQKDIPDKAEILMEYAVNPGTGEIEAWATNLTYKKMYIDKTRSVVIPMDGIYKVMEPESLDGSPAILKLPPKSKTFLTKQVLLDCFKNKTDEILGYRYTWDTSPKRFSFFIEYGFEDVPDLHYSFSTNFYLNSLVSIPIKTNCRSQNEINKALREFLINCPEAFNQYCWWFIYENNLEKYVRKSPKTTFYDFN